MVSRSKKIGRDHETPPDQELHERLHRVLVRIARPERLTSLIENAAQRWSGTIYSRSPPAVEGAEPVRDSGRIDPHLGPTGRRARKTLGAFDATLPIRRLEVLGEARMKRVVPQHFPRERAARAHRIEHRRTDVRKGGRL